MASLKTVRKWEEILNCKINVLQIVDGKVKKIKCVVCTKYESEIKNMKGFSRGWIDGTESVKKDSLEKHVKGEPHKFAKSLDLKKTLGGAAYSEKVVMNSQIGRGIATMRNSEKEVRILNFLCL